MTELLESLELCDECGACLEVCPTYKATRNEEFSPIGRLRAAKKILHSEEVAPQMIDAIYNGPECHLCTDVCPYRINVAEIVARCRVELVRRGLGPLEEHNRIIDGIQRLDNSVNGDPAKRLDWLPEEFPRRESSTLFYMGCLPSYLVKDAAASSYLLLSKLGVDFMLLPDEGCCGVYFQEVGRLDLARERFEQNTDRFRRLGIKRIIVACAGCYRCFKRYYPQLLGDVNFEVVHIVQLLPSLLKERGIKIEDQGIEVSEPPENRENALCCGAGAAVRSVYRDLSLNIATSILDQAPVDPIVTTCPFCNFNLSYASRKTGRDKKIACITEPILQALTKT